jgi:hypothetical protein
LLDAEFVQGVYATSINIHNTQLSSEVQFTKTTVQAFQEGARSSADAAAPRPAPLPILQLLCGRRERRQFADIARIVLDDDGGFEDYVKVRLSGHRADDLQQPPLCFDLQREKLMERKLPEFLRPADVSLLPAQVHELTPEEQRERYFEQREERVEQEPISQILGDLEAELKDPLRVIAERILRLTFEEAMKMADGMHKPEMAAHLTKWARCYVDGVEMPEEVRISLR